MVKGVIFDLDGTVADTIIDLTNAVNYALGLYGYRQYDVSEVRTFVGNGITKLIERSLPEDKRGEDDIANVRAYFMEHYTEHCCDNTLPYDGINELFEILNEKNILISVVTNKACEQARYIMKRLFPEIKFCAIYGHAYGVPHKPDTTLTYKALKDMRITSDECVFVGDSGVDIQTAKNTSMKSIGVSWGFRPRTELENLKADFIADNCEELRRFVLSI